MQRFMLLAAAAALTVSGAHFGAKALAQAAAVKPRTAASIECSRQADEKGLHGKARKHFRAGCIRSMAKSGKGQAQKGLGYR